MDLVEAEGIGCEAGDNNGFASAKPFWAANNSSTSVNPFGTVVSTLSVIIRLIRGDPGAPPKWRCRIGDSDS